MTAPISIRTVNQTHFVQTQSGQPSAKRPGPADRFENTLQQICGTNPASQAGLAPSLFGENLFDLLAMVGQTDDVHLKALV